VGKLRASFEWVTRRKKPRGKQEILGFSGGDGAGTMKKILLATVSMVALTSGARTADMPAAMPAKGPMYSPVPVATWDGAYFGVQGGVARREARLTDPFGNIGALPGQFSLAGDKTGGTLGVLAGYNWQHGNFVYGLEGDWNWIGAKVSELSSISDNSTSYDVNWLATLRARAGFAVDSTLFYLTGGEALGHIRDSFAFLDQGGTITVALTKDGTKAGWTIGAGVEHMFAPQWTARAEFRYVDLGKTSAACTPGADACGEPPFTFSNSLWMGLVGVNYKFGGHAADWPRAHVAPPAASWAGAYLGVQGGIARHDAYFNDRDTFVFNNGLDEQKKTGGAAGGLVGYNWQQGSFVYGLEGDWNWIGAKASQFGSSTPNGVIVNFSTSYDVNWLATFRGRAGLTFDSALLYVTGGVVVGHVKNDVELIGTGILAGSAASFTQNETKVGWTAGVGAEYMFSPHWTARAEFRYVDLGKTNVACSIATDLNQCVSVGYRGDFSNTLKLGLVGLNYKF